jgi:hypothetical protein
MLGQDHGVDRMTAGALRSLAAPGLEAIRIAGLADLTSFLAELTEHPLPDSWAMLHLLGSVGDEDELLAVLRDRAPRLRSIAMLGLPLASALSDHGVAEVKALLPWVVDVSDTPDVWPPSASDAW